MRTFTESDSYLAERLVNMSDPPAIGGWRGNHTGALAKLKT